MLLAAAVSVGACGGSGGPVTGPSSAAPTSTSTSAPVASTTTSTLPTDSHGAAAAGLRSPLPVPEALAPFVGTSTVSGQGIWSPVGRTVGDIPAVYETALVPPGGNLPVGVAWMDMHRLSALLYSGSRSPGNGPFHYSAPIQPAQAATLVAAFNGGFLMANAQGGYYTDGRVVDPLVDGAASMVFYASGDIDIGAWGTDVSMGPDVVGVRQNLVPLVAAGAPTAAATSSDWQAWGATCGAASCAHTVPGIEAQWRSGVGVTASGALVYVSGPALSPEQLAEVLVRAGAQRGMELDINPDWTVLVTYDPATPDGLATPTNGTKLVSNSVQGPWTFFESQWARDFVTLSARSARSA